MARTRTKVKPLTKQTDGGVVYTRRTDAELQIEKTLTLTPSEIFELLGADKKRGETDYLLDETIIYLFREAREAGNDEMFNRLYDELNRRIWKLLAKFRSAFKERADFEDFGQKTEMAILRKIIDTESNAADFAQVQFGSFVIREAKSHRTQNLVKINKEQTLFETARADDEAENPLENISLSNEFNAEQRIIYDEQMRRLSPEQQIITAMLMDGFQVESKDENEMTISKHLGVTSRTIRNRIKELREILSAFRGEMK